MRTIRDRTLVTWELNGKIFNEELIFYNDEEEPSEDMSPEIILDISIDADDLEYVKSSNALPDDETRAALVIVLNDCLEKLSILKCISQQNVPRMEEINLQYKSIEQRFGSDEKSYSPFHYKDHHKRYKDLNMIYTILYNTLDEVYTQGTFVTLMEAIHNMNKQTKEDDGLLKEYQKIKNLENDTKNEITRQGKIIEAKYQVLCEKLHKERNAYEDALAYSKLEYQYLVTWENARENQKKLQLEKEETYYKDLIESYNKKILMENRVHLEIKKYFQETKQDLLDQIDYWQKKYEMDIESRDQELLKLRMEQENQAEKLALLKEKYNEHETFVKHWGAIKEWRRLAAELEDKKERAAIRIQRWWRRMMIKHKLGPYKPKKKKGKNKKEKKKK